jgi:regulator of replication initiation timing
MRRETYKDLEQRVEELKDDLEQRVEELEDDLQQRVEELEEENETLQTSLDRISAIVAGDNVEDDGEFDDNDSDNFIPLDGDEIKDEYRENGVFADAGKYVVGRIQSRRDQKKLERAIAKEAVAKARVDAARKRTKK